MSTPSAWEDETTPHQNLNLKPHTPTPEALAHVQRLEQWIEDNPSNGLSADEERAELALWFDRFAEAQAGEWIPVSRETLLPPVALGEKFMAEWTDGHWRILGVLGMHGGEQSVMVYKGDCFPVSTFTYWRACSALPKAVRDSFYEKHPVTERAMPIRSADTELG